MANKGILKWNHVQYGTFFVDYIREYYSFILFFFSIPNTLEIRYFLLSGIGWELIQLVNKLTQWTPVASIEFCTLVDFFC